VTRTLYGPDGQPISSKKSESGRPPRVEPGNAQFRAMQKTLHLSENQMRGAIRRSLRVAQKSRLKGSGSTLDSVRMEHQQASRDEAKRLAAERKKSREVK
jgi:hypothetical protein